jgi:uncharacterized protein
MRRAGQLTLFIVFAVASLAALAQNFPSLSGRVVDAAHLLQPEQKDRLETKLKAFEERTGDQVVVATVPGLGDLTIEDFANRLFRHWQLGEKAKNNGVLLVVAPRDRKVRIEVGYGLEGALTDALSKVIISTAIAPKFQQGDFDGGIEAGIDAILSILTGDAEQWQRRAEIREDPQGALDPIATFVIFLVLIFIITRAMRSSRGPNRFHRGRRGNWVVIPGPGWGGGSGGGWGGGGGGGFSGGGGSSGGGGASGSW